MDGDRLCAGIALGKVVALEHTCDGVLRGEPDQAGGRHLFHPARIEHDARALGIGDAADDPNDPGGRDVKDRDPVGGLVGRGQL